MLETHLRQAATVLLDSAIRIAPPGTHDWGQAMRGELNYVKGNWAGTMWALGGTTVLAKETLATLLIPGHGGLVADGGLFAKNATLRRAALAIAGACVLAALLFFASPPFRQAFDVALKPWLSMFRTAPANSQPAFDALARKAEARRDAEGMAFGAARMQNPQESARLAQAAVRLDPNFTWVYAFVAMRNPRLKETASWIEKLEQWDPQNALFPLIAAECIHPAIAQAGAKAANQQRGPAWQSAMAMAFHSTKFDDYLDRVAQLNRRVAPRYGLYDPYEVESRRQIDLPNAAFDNSRRYAQSLIQTGVGLEARGGYKAAREQYWTVARFGQLMDSQGRTDSEHALGTALQSMAYHQLQTSAAKEGQRAEAELFGYLAAKFDPDKGERATAVRQSAFGRETSARNAAVVEISGLMIVVFCALALTAALILIAGSRHKARAVTRRARPVATIVILASGVGLLFSTITLYLTYRPYWYIFQSAILNGDQVQSRDLQEFLISTEVLPGIPHRVNVLLGALIYSGSPSFLFYVWAGVTLLGVIGLALILLRRIRGRPRAHAP